MTVGQGRMAVDFLLQAAAPHPSQTPPSDLPGALEYSRAATPVPSTGAASPCHSSDYRPSFSNINCTPDPTLAIMELANAAALASAATRLVPYSPVSTHSAASSVEDCLDRMNEDMNLRPVAPPQLPYQTAPYTPAPRSTKAVAAAPVAPVAASATPAAASVTPTTSIGAARPYTPPPAEHGVATTGMSPAAAAATAALLAPSTPRHNVCPRCGASFNQKIRFLYHLVDAHDVSVYESRTILPCKQCPSAFLRNTDRSKHTACVHERLRPFECNAANCTSSFFFAKDLSKHRSTVHLRYKPFPCTICNKRFGKREHMTSHVKRVHQRLRPFKCDVCDIRLASKYNLQGHLRTAAHAAAQTLADRDGAHRVSAATAVGL